MNPNRSTATPGLNLPQYAEGAHGGGYVNVRPVYNSHPPGRPVLDKRAPRAGHRFVSRGYRFGPAMGSESFRPCYGPSSGVQQQHPTITAPPRHPGVEGGSVWRSVHATATAVGALRSDDES